MLATCEEDYNNARPHSALGNLTPTEHADPALPDRNRRSAALRGKRSALRPAAPPPHGLKCHRDFPHCRMNRAAQTDRADKT
jgi:putative transposase